MIFDLYYFILQYAEKLTKQELNRDKKGLANNYVLYETQLNNLKDFIYKKDHNEKLEKEPPKILSSVPYDDIEDFKK